MTTFDAIAARDAATWNGHKPAGSTEWEPVGQAERDRRALLGMVRALAEALDWTAPRGARLAGREGKSVAPHPWAAFLEARLRAIDWMVADGRSEWVITGAMNMGSLQLQMQLAAAYRAGQDEGVRQAIALVKNQVGQDMLKALRALPVTSEPAAPLEAPEGEG